MNKHIKLKIQKIEEQSKWLKGKVYFLPEFQEDAKLQNIITAARTMWNDRVYKYMDKLGHFGRCDKAQCCTCPTGSCVLGAGIEIYVLRSSRHRNVEHINIINAPGYNQGSLQWEESEKDIVAFLKNNGIECRYNCGRMD